MAMAKVNESQHYALLTQRIGHEFENPGLLTLALTHRSHGADNNERLEFLGDSILNFIIGEWLFERFPEAKEGQLTRLRAQMVKGETLAKIAKELDVSPLLRLGEGENKSGGRTRSSILADVVEAIIGAIYCDNGMQKATQCVLNWFSDRLNQLSLDKPAKDAKTALQEYLQARKLPLPSYQVIAVEGEAHAQLFTIECSVKPLQEGTTRATASSRKGAEKLAAQQMMAQILEGDQHG